MFRQINSKSGLLNAPTIISAVLGVLLSMEPLAIADLATEAGVSTSAMETSQNGEANEHVASVQAFKLRPGIEVVRRVVGPDGTVATAVGEDERLVYGNTLGDDALPLPSGGVVADDITILGPDGCHLLRYTFRIVGKANPDLIGGAYRVDFALYGNCPQAIGPNPPPIAGTTGFIEVDAANDSVVQQVEFIVPPEIDVPLHSTIWLGLKANRANVGVVAGAPALVGFSGDKVDYPGFPCNADGGGYPFNPHASFYSEVYVRGDCPITFPGYRNSHPGRAGFREGTNWCMADDIQLGVDQCSMVGYDVGVRLASTVSSGTFSVQLHSDNDELPSAFIVGSDRVFPITGGPGAYVLRATFDPPIALSGNKVWAAVQGDNSGTSWIVTNSDAQIGRTENGYARSSFLASNRSCMAMQASPQFEAAFLYDPRAYGGFDVTIHCAGEAPQGACCDIFHSDNGGLAPCREVPRMNCWPDERRALSLPDSARTWFEATTCEQDPFPFACGLAACCKPDDTCENLTEADCRALVPPGGYIAWQRLQYCGEDMQKCPFHACLQRQGDCYFARPDRGCDRPFCCHGICERDKWCCYTEWDLPCIRGVERQGSVACYRPASNHICYSPPESLFADTSLAVPVGNSVIVGNYGADAEYSDATFACHPDGPGQPGFRALWYYFIATDTSARIHTCDTLPPNEDVIMNVYSVGDPSTPETACGTLEEIACVDDTPGCGRSGQGADVCIDHLIPGEPYYVQLASVNLEDRGAIQLNIESPCVPTTTASDPRIEFVDPILEPRDCENSLRTGRRFSPPHPRPSLKGGGIYVRNGHVSVQVNVDANGNNIVGDAANTPSIAVDPTNPDRMVMAWRQFDSVLSDFRQAGWAYSHDGGVHWSGTRILEPGVPRTLPVLDSDANGFFYFYSAHRILPKARFDLFRSTDSGISWGPPTEVYGGDKSGFIVDKTLGPGQGHIYLTWTPVGSCCGTGHFSRSTDGGLTFEKPIEITPNPRWNTLAVGTKGEVYAVGQDGIFTKSLDAWNAKVTPTFFPPMQVTLGGPTAEYGTLPNSNDFAGQTWIVSDHSDSVTRGNIYIVAMVHREAAPHDPLDLVFVRSTNGGETWSRPLRVNDDPPGNGAWQWFSVLSIAPNGRLDLIWNDTRNSSDVMLNELFYTYSYNAGVNWAPNVPVSPVFDTSVGLPDPENIGYYYHAVSDNRGVNIAYAATFNGEQDIYFLRIEQSADCNGNQILDIDEVAKGLADDCNMNQVPDVCEPDLDGDGVIDTCDSDADNDGVADDNDICLYLLGGPSDENGRPLADTTGQCDIDLDDYWRFRNCMVNGRLGAPAPIEACRNAFDRDADSDIDLRDFQTFMTAFTGRH